MGTDRRHLMFFNVAVPLEIRTARTDTSDKIDVAANLQAVAGDPATATLMRRCLSGAASAEDMRRFAAAWQDRVRRILLERGEDPEVFVVCRASGAMPPSSNAFPPTPISAA